MRLPERAASRLVNSQYICHEEAQVSKQTSSSNHIRSYRTHTHFHSTSTITYNSFPDPTTDHSFQDEVLNNDPLAPSSRRQQQANHSPSTRLFNLERTRRWLLRRCHFYLRQRFHRDWQHGQQPSPISTHAPSLTVTIGLYRRPTNLLRPQECKQQHNLPRCRRRLHSEYRRQRFDYWDKPSRSG